MKLVATILAIAALGSGNAGREPITFYGVGLVKVGATVQEATNAVRSPLQATPDRGEELSCHFVQLKSKPGLFFMVEDGRITRAETDDRRYQTASGIRVGDSEARVRDVYGPRLEVEEHKYDPSGHNLIVRSADRRFALVMETDGKKVVYIRAGQLPSAEYVEGCL
jgi:hypothetical protein